MDTLSTDAPITPLRQRMQDDMRMRGLGQHTQRDYIRHVRGFAAFLGRSPDRASKEDVRRFQLHQHEHGMTPSTINSAVSALRFLFTVTLRRQDLARSLVLTRNPLNCPMSSVSKRLPGCSKPRRASSTRRRSVSPMAQASGCRRCPISRSMTSTARAC